ncbi:MAG: glycoside hydrolase 5 family protein [Actinomycetota bacterium]
MRTDGAPASPAPFRLGINYWPSRTAMRWWSEFDAGEVARDFGRIAANGFDSVRFFLLWEAFQPEPDRVDASMLERLVTVADAADRAGLSMMPTLFTGHMSGVDWIPRWALGGTERDERFRVVSGRRVVPDGLRNWYVDPEIVRAQALLAGEAAAALAGHRSMWAWDLGNENSNCVVPPDRNAARRWLAETSGAIRSADDSAAVTIGIHMEDLEQDRRLGPAEAAEACDFLTMHGYPIYTTWANRGTDEHLVPFLARITRWLGDGADVLFSEFGLPTVVTGEEEAPPLVGEEDAARYTQQVLGGLRFAGCTGAMLWCYADYVRSTWSDPPFDQAIHERSFGLWRADGSPKPAVDIVAASVGAARLDPPEDAWIDIDPGRYWEQPGVELPRLYRRFTAAIDTP